MNYLPEIHAKYQELQIELFQEKANHEQTVDEFRTLKLKYQKLERSIIETKTP